MKKYGPAIILAAGISATLAGLAAANAGPTVTHYEDGSVVIDNGDGTELVTVVPGSAAATD